MAVRVSIHSEHFQRATRILRSEQDARKAVSRALNRAMDSAKVETFRQVPKDYAVKQKQVRDRVTTSKASENNLAASVSWRGYALNIADFAVRPGRPNPKKRSVLRAMVSRDSGYQEYKGAFLINTTRGLQAFRRRTQNDGRYPITGVWGPSIPQLIGSDRIKDVVEKRAREQMDARLDHEINRMLDGYK